MSKELDLQRRHGCVQHVGIDPPADEFRQPRRSYPRCIRPEPKRHRRYYRGNIAGMPLAHSKLTAQGQISVPAEVRRRLGVGPGAVLEWVEEGESIVVRRAGRSSSEDVHRAAFPQGPPTRRSLAALKAGLRRYARERHARG